MSKERYNQIIDNAYKRFSQIRKSVLMLKPPTSEEKLREYIEWYEQAATEEKFINKCKTDQEFSEMWGLKIEEKELSLDERMQIWNERTEGFYIMLIWGHGKTQEESLSEQNIPTKQTTLTYQNESIQFYE
jgi:hypothetical protein